jgi:hypothetical protein
MPNRWTRRASLLGLATTVVILAGTSLFAADNWPQFRGPGSRGTSDEHDLP